MATKIEQPLRDAPSAQRLSPAMIRALQTAAARERASICPIVGLHAAASTQLLKAMDRRGFVTWDGPSPRISDAGRAVAAANNPEEAA